MARPSTIDRLPDEIKEEIGRLRRSGRTIDEVLAKLRELLPEGQQPSRAAMGRHVQKIDVMGQRIRERREMANAIVDRVGDGAENKLTRLNAEILETILTDLMIDENGQPVTLSAKDAAFLSATLERVARSKRIDADLILKLRKEIAAEAAQAVETVARQAGLSADLLSQLKAGIFGKDAV